MFSQNLMNSIGVDFKLKNIMIDTKRIKLQIWDTAGQERFRTITTTYYKGAQAIIIVFDLTDKDSFDHLKTWLADIDKYAKEGVMKVLVGNKCDLVEKREVSSEMVRDFSKKYGMEYVETSAKDASNVESLFVSTTKTFISNSSGQTKKNQKDFTPGISLSNTQQKTEEKKDCC